MAFGYVCALCGWQEALHNNFGADLSDEEQESLDQALPECTSSFMDCSGYTPSQEEVEAVEADARERGLR